MQRILSVILTFGMLANYTTAAPDVAAVKRQIAGMSIGKKIDLRLKTQEKLRGARGTTSDTGFALVNPKGGERQIAFDDVASVKPHVVKSHTVRNILIGVGIVVVAVGVTLGLIISKC
jgi:hypothetical protein